MLYLHSFCVSVSEMCPNYKKSLREVILGAQKCSKCFPFKLMVVFVLCPFGFQKISWECSNSWGNLCHKPGGLKWWILFFFFFFRATLPPIPLQRIFFSTLPASGSPRGSLTGSNLSSVSAFLAFFLAPHWSTLLKVLVSLSFLTKRLVLLGENLS